MDIGRGFYTFETKPQGKGNTLFRICKGDDVLAVIELNKHQVLPYLQKCKRGRYLKEIQQQLLEAIHCDEITYADAIYIAKTLKINI